MRKSMGMLLGTIGAVLLVLAISCTPADTDTSSYAENRARIENLQARYMFAMNSFEQWLFSKRTIYNETGAEWMAPPGNPCW
jgi:hypothetical protein